MLKEAEGIMMDPRPEDHSKQLLARIEKLIEIGVGMTAQKDTNRLLETILLGAKALTGADGGTLYLATEDRHLRFEILHTTSLGMALGGSSGEAITFPPIPLDLEDGRPNTQMVVSYAAISGEIVNIPDAYAAEGFDFSGTRAFDARSGYCSRSFLTVPMKNHEETLIGVLQLINAQDVATGAIIAFSAEDQRLVASLASQASVALTKNFLIEDLKRLFDSLIHLIATAIDDKSPYTGGHCRRVPVIALLLADAVAQADAGPFKDFRFGDAERYELEIAAWLHDCGKITTPEHVIDKATKLEAICDRIQLVESRFEIIRRDAELASLRARLESGAQPEAAESHLVEIFQQIDDDLAFLRQCNRGGEFMPEADQARVRAIAATYRWQDATGVTQPLLSHEELENLLIARGTLNHRERELINSHAATTIRMLESLPLPTYLRNLPEIAGGHHERVDGHGYPRGLVGSNMSVQARIMAIADVFEALTAIDRPYKKAKTLSETLRIMGYMQLEGHIDPDLFALFVQKRIYENYARDYMQPEQIDTFDPTTLPGYAVIG